MEEKMTRDDMFFFGAYILYVTVAVIQHTQLWNVLPQIRGLEILRIGAVLALCIKIILDKKYIGKQVGIFCIIASIVFISCLYSKTFNLFYFVCFAFEIKDISYLKVLRVTFFINIIVIVMVVIGLCTGLISNEMMGTVVWSETMISDEFTERNTLGFIHPNTASAVVFFTTMTYMCMRSTCSFFDFIVSFGINFAVYQRTGSRTCFLITVVFLPLIYLFANKKQFQRYWQIFFIIVSPIIVLTATFMQAFYDPNNKFLMELNSLLSSRLQLGHQALLNYGVPLFGQNILWIADWNNEYGLPYNYVDSAYMRVLLENGIILYILLCIIIVITMYRLVKVKNGKLCVAFLSLLVYSMVEMSIYDISWAPFCLLMGQMAALDNKE